MPYFHTLFAGIIFLTLLFISSSSVSAATPTTTAVSVSSSGIIGNNTSNSNKSAISADGRFVVFESDADNLVSGDTNGTSDVFVHDRQTGTTTRVSVTTDGVQGNGSSESPAISADGRFISFTSYADNLVSGDTNGFEDVFVHDRQTGTTTRVSVTTDGMQGNYHSFSSAISADGRFVSFVSWATNLVSGNSHGTSDVFVHDRQSGTTTRVSVTTGGIQGNNYSGSPAISADGRFVSFHSNADNLVSGDSNGTSDVFVHDRQTGTTTRVSVTTGGIQGNNYSGSPAISADGRFVSFSSYADNLVSGDSNGPWDVFVHDRQTGTTTRVSVTTDGIQGNSDSSSPAISADGRFVTFSSQADNLVSGDSNGFFSDVFVHDRPTSFPWPMFLPAITGGRN